MTQLTSAHRALIARIQDLCIDISLHHPELVAECQYTGHTHELTVALIPRAHLAVADGGDGSYRSCWNRHVYLPGAKPRSSDEDTLDSLALVINHLEGLQHAPGGAA